MYTLFTQASRFFSRDQLARLVQIGYQLPSFYQRLYAEAALHGERMWKLTPKLHLVQELLIYTCAQWGNPVYYWCYSDEDLVGLMIEIAKSCHVSTLAATALVKWLILCFDCDETDE